MDRLAEAHSEARSLSKGALYLFLAQVATLIGGALVHAAGSRYLTFRQYSQFVLAISITVVMQLLLTTGFPKTLSYLASRSPQNAWQILKKGIGIILPASILVFIVYGLVCLYAGRFSLDSTGGILFIAGFVLPPAAILFSALGILNGLQLYKLEAIATSLHSVIRSAAITLLLIVTNSVIYGLVGNAIAALAAVGIAVIAMGRNLPRDGASSEANIADGIKQFGIPVTVFGILMVCLMSLDLWMADLLIREDEKQALFSCAHTITAFLVYPAMAVSRSIFSPLVRAISGGHSDEASNIFEKSILFIEFGLLPLALATMLFPNALIQILYPKPYYRAGALFPGLALGSLAISFIHIGSAVLMASQKTWECVLFVLGGCSLVAATSFAAYNYGGAIGIAWAYGAACATVCVLFMMRLMGSLRVRLLDRKKMISLVLGLAASVGAHYVVLNYSPETQMQWNHFSGYIFIVLVFPGIALCMGTLRRQHFDFLLSSFRKSR